MATLGLSRNIMISKFLKFRRITFREITTSGKKKESTGTCAAPETVYQKVPDFSKPLENKNWVSFGLDWDNKDDDVFLTHVFFFSFITLIIGGYIFTFAYYPDRGRKDWIQREAFIRLYEREQLGLEPIDPNYIDPSKVILPPDSELEEHEIII